VKASVKVREYPVRKPDNLTSYRRTTLGQKLLVLEATTADEIDAQFARLQEPADAMLVARSPFFLLTASGRASRSGAPLYSGR
jgi:hypothetical protein